MHGFIRRFSAPAIVAIVIAFLAAAAASAADVPLRDLPGAKDPPYIGRFTGSTIVGYAELAFDQSSFPLTNEVSDRQFVKAQTVEGRITRVVYLAPFGKSRIEVQRNYQEALSKAGFVKKFSCDGDGCGRGSRIQEPFIRYAQTMKQMASYGGQSDVAFVALNTDQDPHYIWGTLKADGRDVAVSIFISTLSATDDSPLHNRIALLVEVVEPKAMQSGQVTIDANAMKKGLDAQGRIALYGVYFDTGKADVRPESKPQLDEMAKLLDTDKSIKVFIVGHTDNQGLYDANVSLSQRRADAISAALVRDYHVDAKRLIAKGVANLSPVASNDADAGRSKNRRVELVKQ